MYQTPFADRIRNEVGIATMAVGAISEADLKLFRYTDDPAEAWQIIQEFYQLSTG